MKLKKLIIIAGASVALMATPFVITGCSGGDAAKKDDAAPTAAPESAPMEEGGEKKMDDGTAPASAPDSAPAEGGGEEGGGEEGGE